MIAGICFTSFYLFIYFLPDIDVIMTLLRYLFVALLTPFSYKDKRLACTFGINRSRNHNQRIH